MMENCPQCGEKLNVDEKAAGKCFTCGASFESSLPAAPVQYDADAFDDQDGRPNTNPVSKLLGFVGHFILILGFLLSLYHLLDGEEGSSGAWSEFWSEASDSTITGLILVGIAEVVQLLEEIKRKMK